MSINTTTHRIQTDLTSAFRRNHDVVSPTFAVTGLCGGLPEELEGWYRADDVSVWASAKIIPPPSNCADSGKLYKTLVDKYEIRVLEIKPGVGEEPLRGSLHHCSIEFDDVLRVDEQSGLEKRHFTKYALSMQDFQTPIRYTALSYTWGAPVFDAKIECDGHEAAITKSLEAALRHLRCADRSIVLWVDQVCINQEDTKEKEQQIPLMSNIYRHAEKTVVWLGEGSEGSESALRLLEDFDYRLQFMNSDISPAEFERMNLPNEDSQDWKDIWDVLTRAWFSRVWIIQETILSWDLWVACGDATITWYLLANACTHMNTCGISRWLQEKFGPQDGVSDDVCQSIADLGNMKSQYDILTRKPSLFDLIVATRPSLCYDARDKIYGLLGVCSDDDKEAVRISYTDFTAPDLYHDMVIHHMLEDRSGDRLSKVLCSVEHDSDDLPSWVPDWRRRRQTTSLGYAPSTRNAYNACGRFLSLLRLDLYKILPDDKGKIFTPGVVCDSLVDLSGVFADPDLSNHDPTVNNRDLMEAADFALRLKDLVDDDLVFDAFWHAIVAGKDGSAKAKCPPSYAEVISLLLDESTGRSPSLPGQTYSVRQKRPKGKGRLELSNLTQRALGQTFQEVRIAMKAALRNRRMGITKNGRLGLFPSRGKDGDIICVLEGCHVPFLMRPAGQDMFQVVGECYVHGIMAGEAVNEEHISMEQVVLI